MTTLPTLTGSDKHIQWANHIRREKLKWTEIAVNKMMRDPDIEDKGELTAAYAKLQQQASAAWWINNRNLDEIGLLMKVEE